MIIAIASGKGGTGKTTVATNLAAVLADSGRTVAYVDCDVEEPNGHIFIQPDISFTSPVNTMIPSIDYEKCNLCGVCVDICRFNALAVAGEKVLLFTELCHGCGGCTLLCPQQAVSEIPRQIGEIKIGSGTGVTFVDGCLNIGEAQAPPVTRAVKKSVPPAEITIIDSPPGTSCPVIAAVKGADFAVLVTEPTPFGLSDLKLASGMLEQMKIPFGVVINRSDIGNDEVEKFCQSAGIEILLSLPHDRAIAEGYSRGGMILRDTPRYHENLLDLFRRIRNRVVS